MCMFVEQLGAQKRKHPITLRLHGELNRARQLNSQMIEQDLKLREAKPLAAESNVEFLPEWNAYIIITYEH